MLQVQTVNHSSEWPKEEARLIRVFLGEGHVSGLYVADIRNRTSRDEEEAELRLLGGKSDLQENILGLHFRVSPQAFFQVNTQCANLLIDVVVDELRQRAKPGATVIDVCCGVGAIGICCAKLAAEKITGVMGVEIIPDAVEDAKYNARYLNGLKNAVFQCAKVEDVMGRIMKEKGSSDDEVIAILNPPRAGVGNSCLRVRWRLYIYIYTTSFISEELHAMHEAHLYARVCVECV